MPIRITQLNLPIHHGPDALRKKILSELHVKEQDLLSYTVRRRSIDARKKDNILFSYVVDAAVRDEASVLRRCHAPQVSAVKETVYRAPACGTEPLPHRPVIIGTGPAGLFAGLLLARKGYRPLILERGLPAAERKQTVERFWEGGALDPESNVSFGEGGAGTFSDGKLNTLVKDPCGRNRAVLETFVRFGADPEILWQQMPHVGTDRLIGIVGGIRREIERLGGEVRFAVRAEHLVTENGALKGVRVIGTGKSSAEKEDLPGRESSDTKRRRTDCSVEEIPCEALIAAIGHSARDTFQNFLSDGIAMEPKAFALGVRIQHPQHMIDVSQYGEKEAAFLSPAVYKLTGTFRGRGVYTFCMCPGGYVVNASTEPERIAVNGMSYHGRASGTANSAVIVTVTPEDFGSTGPLSGIAFQRSLEERAFRAGNGSIPVQLFGDFAAGRITAAYGDVEPCFRGQTAFADLNPVLGPELCKTLCEGITMFDRRLHGFARPDAILAGVESRTSSPVRIPRDAGFVANIDGFYPCGEGAGFAGGITSAAMDGLKCAEALIRRFAPPR